MHHSKGRFNYCEMKTFFLILISVFFLHTISAQTEKVLVLDGCTNYFEIPDNDLMDYNQVLSLECWIRPNCEDGNRIILSKQFCQGEYGYYLSVNEGRLLWSYSSTGFCSSPNNYQTEEIEILPNVFTHVAVVHNQDEIKLFVNAEEVAQGQFVGNFSSIHNSSEPFRIGAYKNINGEISNFYSGLIDEVRMWNFELNSQLIQDRMNTILSGGELGLILYFNMESVGVGAGLTLYNQSDYDSIFDAFPAGYAENTPRTIYPGEYDVNLIDLGEDLVTCESSVTLTAGIEHYKSLEWNNGYTGDPLVVTESGQYEVTVETELCKFYSDDINIIFSEELMQSFDLEICENDTVFIGSNIIFQEGVYLDTLVSGTGCDTISQYNVSLIPQQSTTVELETCPNGIVFYEGTELSAGTITNFEFVGTNGCDSVVIVQVEPTLVFQETLFLEVCEGEAVEYDGQLLYPGTSNDFLFTSVEGCDSIVTVNVEAMPVIQTFLGPDQVVCTESFLLESPDDQTLWSDGSVGANFLVNTAGTYTASFADEHGCMVSDTIQLSFSEGSFFVPNAFSPNDDGINDCLEIFLSADIQVKDFHWSIYNRWGGLVFQTENIGDCWDGSIKGQTAQSGVYVWAITGLDPGCQEDTFWKGDVTLVR